MSHAALGTGRAVTHRHRCEDRERGGIVWIPNLGRLEMDITYACGFGCLNCNRMTVLAPGTRDTNVTVAQIERLIAESVELAWPWQIWGLIGGEPTVHPDFLEMLGTIVEYRRLHNPALLIRVSTHGAGERTARILAEVSARYPFVHIRNSRKTTPLQNDFDQINVAPRDRDDLMLGGHQFSGCAIPAECGIGFNYAGFYCCAIAGAIDRICGLERAIHSLHDLTLDELVAHYPAFCSMCGHYRPTAARGAHPVSPSWKVAFAEYEKRRPVLERY
jgi:hypothetical protein